MAYEFATVVREERMTLITLNRPDVLNALHPPAHHELADIFDRFEGDPEQWVAVITGSGSRSFCAGNDLKFRAEEGRQPMPVSGFGGLTSRFDLDKPVIAAVNGLALGGGFELALACDLVIADEPAEFGLPEVRVGLAPLAGGLQRLAQQVGLKAAMGIALTGRRVSAAKLLQMGWLNELVPAGEAVMGARRWAAAILRAAPLAVRASKRVMLHGLDASGIQEALQTQDELPAVLAMRASADSQEGPQAFVQKRSPQWRGQ